MTRSLKAWKGWAAVTVIIRVAVGQARFASQRRDKEQARFSAIRSANRPIWAVSVSVLVFSCVASTALAGQRTSLHAHLETTRIEKKSGQSNGTTAASRRTQVDPPRCGPAGHAIHPNGEILALGSGYGTPGGSCPVQALQRRLAATGYAPGPMDGLYGPADPTRGPALPGSLRLAGRWHRRTLYVDGARREEPGHPSGCRLRLGRLSAGAGAPAPLGRAPASGLDESTGFTVR